MHSQTLRSMIRPRASSNVLERPPGIFFQMLIEDLLPLRKREAPPVCNYSTINVTLGLQMLHSPIPHR